MRHRADRAGRDRLPGCRAGGAGDPRRRQQRTTGNQCVGVFGYVTGVCVITLTVTDAAGQSHSDSMVMVFLDQSPD